MVEIYNPSIGPAQGQEIKLSDQLYDIIENDLPKNTQMRIIDEIEEAAAQHPNHTIDFLGNDPASYHVTKELLGTAWGFRFINAVQQTPLEKALDTINQHPDITREIADQAAQELLDKGVHFVTNHQEEIQQAIEIATDLN